MDLRGKEAVRDLVRARTSDGQWGVYEDESFERLLALLNSDHEGARNQIAKLEHDLKAEMQRSQILREAHDKILDEQWEKGHTKEEIIGISRAALRIARDATPNEINELLHKQIMIILKLRAGLSGLMDLLDYKSAWPTLHIEEYERYGAYRPDLVQLLKDTAEF